MGFSTACSCVYDMELKKKNKSGKMKKEKSGKMYDRIRDLGQEEIKGFVKVKAR